MLKSYAILVENYFSDSPELLLILYPAGYDAENVSHVTEQPVMESLYSSIISFGGISLSF